MTNNVLPSGSIAVSRNGPDGQLGYSWTVTFLENSKLTFSQSQLLFNYATSSLTGSGVNLYVNKLKSATYPPVPIGGYFALTFRGMRTAYLACDSTAREVADALRALDSIGDVAVVRLPVYYHTPTYPLSSSFPLSSFSLIISFLSYPPTLSPPHLTSPHPLVTSPHLLFESGAHGSS